MIDPQKKLGFAQVLDNAYQKVDEFGDDTVTTSDIQLLLEAHEMGYASIVDVNILLEEYGFYGETIKGSAEKLWRVEVK
jgi:hypothetical protein